MYRYLVIIEKVESNYGAYSPDVPGCVAVGDSIEETLQSYNEALQFHLQGALQDGDPIPEPHSVTAEFVQVELPAQVSVTTRS